MKRPLHLGIVPPFSQWICEAVDELKENDHSAIESYFKTLERMRPELASRFHGLNWREMSLVHFVGLVYKVW